MPSKAERLKALDKRFIAALKIVEPTVSGHPTADPGLTEMMAAWADLVVLMTDTMEMSADVAKTLVDLQRQFHDHLREDIQRERQR